MLGICITDSQAVTACLAARGDRLEEEVSFPFGGRHQVSVAVVGHHAAGIEPEDDLTGQTGSEQARLTLGGSVNDVHGIGMQTPLSGSHLNLHCRRITRSVQQGRLQRSSLFLVHALMRRLLLLQLQSTPETIN